MSQNFAVRFYSAVLELRNGHVERGLLELLELYNTKENMDTNLQAEVIYSLGVGLSMSGNPLEALKILNDYRDKEGYGSVLFNKVQVTVEISSAYIKLGDFKSALVEAQKAIDLMLEMGITDPVAYLTKGIAEAALKELNKSEKDLKQALSVACEKGDIITAACACEHIGRTALYNDSLDEALSWATKSKDIYYKHSPQFLNNAISLIKKINDSAGGKSLKFVNPSEFALLNDLIDSLDEIEYDCRMDLLDIDLYQFLSAINHKGPFWIALPISSVIKKVDELAKLVHTEIKSIARHPYYPKIFSNSFLFNYLGLKNDQLPTVDTLLSSYFNVLYKHEKLPGQNITFYWECQQGWPLGFMTILKSLTNIYLVAYYNMILMEKQFHDNGYEAPEVISLGGRIFPRAIQSKYFGLGSYHSGCVQIPSHLFEDLTREGLKNQKKNIQKFINIGYLPSEAKNLSDGGLVAILPSEVRSLINDSNSQVISFGGLPIDEYNLVNFPRHTLDAMTKENKDEYIRPGWFLDKYYQTIFTARTLKDYALYGDRKLFRDHYDEFRKKVNIVSSIRTKHYIVPIIEAGSVEELRNIFSYIPKFPELDTGIYFRGQTKPYSLKRTESVKNILFGENNVIEPSLLGAAPRKGVNYNRVHSMLQLLIQDFIYNEANKAGKNLDYIHEEWYKAACSPSANWDTAVMAIAQHYGIPTFGIDITSSLDVAIWFATNKLTFYSDGTAEYIPIKEEEWPQDPEQWPVVYIIQPVTTTIIPSIRNIEQLTNLGIKALRPERQHALFFMGSYGIHQNRLAEALVCQVRLKPGKYDTKLTYNYLFPNADNDTIYKFMLNLREKYANGPYKKFFSEILPFRYEDKDI